MTARTYRPRCNRHGAIATGAEVSLDKGDHGVLWRQLVQHLEFLGETGRQGGEPCGGRQDD